MTYGQSRVKVEKTEMGLITDHWWRCTDDNSSPTAETPCAYTGCGQNYWAHRQAVGEWLEDAHWWRPGRRCRRCGHTARHSVHILVGQRPELRVYKSRWAWRIKNWRRR